MLRILTIALTVIIFVPASGEEPPEYRWSPLDAYSHEAALETAAEFLETFNTKRYDRTRALMHPAEMTTDGSLWTGTERFLYDMLKYLKGGRVGWKNLRAYTFDECEADTEGKSAAMTVYRAYDSLSLVAVAEILPEALGPSGASQCVMVLRRSNKGGGWYISAVNGLSATKPELKPEPPGGDILWKKEDFRQFGFRIMIPRQFSETVVERLSVNYFLPGRTRNDAAFQIVATDGVRPLAVEARAFIRRIVRHGEFSNLKAGYLPNGYRFSFDFTGSDGRRNRIMIAALRNNGYSIFASFMGFTDVFDRWWKEAEYSLHNIVLW